MIENLKILTDWPRSKDPQMLKMQGVKVTKMTIFIISPKRLLKLKIEKMDDKKPADPKEIQHLLQNVDMEFN